MKEIDPFQPPLNIKNFRLSAGFYEALRKISKVLTIVSAVSVIGLVFAPFFAIMWALANRRCNLDRKNAVSWFGALAEQSGATLADIGVYFGGHPLLPEAGKCAFYLRDSTLEIQHEMGVGAEIPLSSIELTQPIAEASNFGVGTFHDVAGVGIGFFHQPVKSYLQIGFSDDKGFSNLVTIGGTVFLEPSQWSNQLTAARYRAT